MPRRAALHQLRARGAIRFGEVVRLVLDHGTVDLEHVPEDPGSALTDAHVGGAQPPVHKLRKELGQGAQYGGVGGRAGGLVQDGEGEEVCAGQRRLQGGEDGGRVGNGENAGEVEGREELDCQGEQRARVLGRDCAEDLGERREEGRDEWRGIVLWS